MRILDRSVYVGPSLYAHFPVIRLESTSARSRSGPRPSSGPPSSTRLLEALPGPARARLLLRRAGRVHPAADARTRAPGWATSSSTSRSSCRTWPASRSRSARPAAPARTGHYHVVYQYEQEDVGLEAGRLGAHAAALAAAARAPAGRRGARRLRLRRRARRVHPLRAAARAGAEHDGAGARGGGAAASRGSGSTSRA